MEAGFHWRKVEEAFVAAVELPEPEQAAYLATLAASVREEVEALLRGHQNAEHWLPSPPDDAAPGTMAGPYRLVEWIGEGGMGRVYRAERADGEFHKAVAVKLIHPEAFRLAGTSDEAMARFRIERQILAILEHPNIVRLLDAGVTANGVSYLVMELVAGEPLTKYCESRALPLDERLRLFQQVCRAIEHAHQHQIVHRDIKPANILVTPVGEVKVLDFGIAKLLAPQPEGESLTTRFVPMTPDYASPEHRRGLPVTTGSDIYSLGLVLFELIARRKPDRTHSPLPAAGAPGDLDSVVRKACAEDPAERYASAVELSRDIGRFLRGEPVAARQPTLRYVFWSSVKRNRGRVLASLTLVLLMAGAFGWQERKVTLERQRRYEQVRAVTRTMIVDLQARIRDLPGSLETRKILIEQALGYLESLRREAGGDARFDVEVGMAYLEMAALESSSNTSNLGNIQGARASLDKARQLAESVLSRNRADLPAQRLLAACWERASSFQFSGGSSGDARMDAAERSFAIRRDIAQAHPDDFRSQKDFAAAFQFVALATTDTAKSAALFTESLARLEALLRQSPSDRDLLRNAALAAKYIAGRDETEGRLEQALASQQRALALDRQLLGSSPNDRTSRLDVAIDLCAVGTSQARLRRLEEAESALHTCVAMRESLVNEEPRDARARDRLAFARVLFAAFWNQASKPARALEQTAEAIRLAEDLTRESPAMAASTTATEAQAYRHRALAFAALGQRAQSCDAFRKAAVRLDRTERLFKGRAAFSPDEAAQVRTGASNCGSL